MYAVDASTGVRLWAENLCGEDMEASPAVANGFVYVVCDDGNVDALNPENGETLWSFYMGHDDSSPPSAAVANGIVYVGGWDNALHALDAHSGALLWSYLTGGPVGSPVVANGVVYVGSGDFNVYAFSVSDNDRERRRVVSDPSVKTLHPDLMLQPQRSARTN
jgi:outer membrane protein assembly factor BamB